MLFRITYTILDYNSIKLNINHNIHYIDLNLFIYTMNNNNKKKEDKMIKQRIFPEIQLVVL